MFDIADLVQGSAEFHLRDHQTAAYFRGFFLLLVLSAIIVVSDISFCVTKKHFNS
jgi:hypothetical protein